MLKIGQLFAGIVALATLAVSGAGPEVTQFMPVPGAVVLFAAAVAMMLRHRELRPA